MKNNMQINPLFYRGFWTEVGSRSSLYYKQTTKNPKWLLMSVLSRFNFIRSIVAFFSRQPLSQKYLLNDSIFEELNVDDVVESLKQDGFYLGIKLPKSVLQDILDFAISKNCYGDADKQFGFSHTQREQAEEKYGKNFVRGEYFSVSLNCPAIKKLESDPKLLAIAAKYLGTEPGMTRTRLWWLFVVNKKTYDLSKGVHFFHYDMNDYQCFSFFFYLTDVDLSSGSHLCVRGSHKNKKLAHLLSLFTRRPEQDIIDYYGDENIVPICGEAGFGFAEDVFCFHKATPPTHKDRLMLEIRFTINNYSRKHNTFQVQKQRIKERIFNDSKVRIGNGIQQS